MWTKSEFRKLDFEVFLCKIAAFKVLETVVQFKKIWLLNQRHGLLTEGQTVVSKLHNPSPLQRQTKIAGIHEE